MPFKSSHKLLSLRSLNTNIQLKFVDNKYTPLVAEYSLLFLA